ncbi:hypothetical protein [Streptomyces antibioticus]|uniref:hypothetical protein n=1 Tax=Streptomyces antibioticus TaxID=1890 RepID=UPI0036D87B51
MALVGRTAPEFLGPRGSGLAGPAAAVADLAAVRLYLDEEWAWLDPALLEGARGAHLSLARCVASGLRGLPVHRGPAIARTGVGVGTAVADWYRGRHIVVDHGFWSATTSAAALSAGGCGFLAWSVTGRRTAAVDPHTPERVVFLPGTRFKVLGTTGDRQPFVLLREIVPAELDGHPDGGGPTSRRLDENTVAALGKAAARHGTPRPAAFMGPRERPPGLIVAGRPGSTSHP